MNPIDLQQQLADQRRGRYVRVSDVDRRLLIDTYKKGEDFIALAKKLNIKRSTARSILRTYIDEGRVSAKQRAGTRLRFITEEEAEMIREMKRRHPLITIGQIQMRLQRTSNRVLSKASISRILTNSIRLGKRAKRSSDGDDDPNQSLHQDEFLQMSSDENTAGAVYIDDDDDEEDESIMENQSAGQNLEDFQRFMLRKTSLNGDEPIDQYQENGYPGNYGSEEDEDEMSDENETTPVDLRSEITSTVSGVNGSTAALNENGTWDLTTNSSLGRKAEPVCVFLNRNYDENSSDSEHLQDQPLTIDEETNKSNHADDLSRSATTCPLCQEQNLSDLSEHLSVVHNLDDQEISTILSCTDRSRSLANVSTSSPRRLDASPQQTPISINTNNQQITCPSSPSSENDASHSQVKDTGNSLTTSSSPNDQQSSNYLSLDGKKRLLCPRCDTWVLNLTDHLIKKHHLSSKQERLPFLRLARNRYATQSTEPNNSTSAAAAAAQSFLISPEPSAKNRKKPFPTARSSPSNPDKESADFSSLLSHPSLLTMNSIQSLINASQSNNICKQEKFKYPLLTSMKTSNQIKDQGQLNMHQKFEQRLTVFRQQFAVTLAMQNSLMQQMELLQRSFVSIEDEWNDMKKEIFS